MYLTIEQLERVTKNFNKVMDNVHVVKNEDQDNKQEVEKNDIHN